MVGSHSSLVWSSNAAQSFRDQVFDQSRIFHNVSQKTIAVLLDAKMLSYESEYEMSCKALLCTSEFISLLPSTISVSSIGSSTSRSYNRATDEVVALGHELFLFFSHRVFSIILMKCVFCFISPQKYVSRSPQGLFLLLLFLRTATWGLHSLRILPRLEFSLDRDTFAPIHP